jgi:hypothetical protein
MKTKDRADLRVIVANIIQIAARVPHEPDTLVAAVDWFEKWIDDVGDHKVMRAVSPLIHPPNQEEINMLQKIDLDEVRRRGGGGNSSIIPLQ